MNLLPTDSQSELYCISFIYIQLLQLNSSSFNESYFYKNALDNQIIFRYKTYSHQLFHTDLTLIVKIMVRICCSMDLTLVNAIGHAEIPLRDFLSGVVAQWWCSGGAVVVWWWCGGGAVTGGQFTLLSWASCQWRTSLRCWVSLGGVNASATQLLNIVD